MWPTKIKLLDMFNAFWGIRKEKIEKILIKFEFFFENFGFGNHLKS